MSQNEKQDFFVDVRIGRQNGEPTAQIISHQLQNDPAAAERFNRELEQAAAKLQDALRRAYAPDEHSNGKGGRLK